MQSDKYIPYVPAETVSSRLYFSDDDAQRVAQYQTEIEGYVRQNTAAFITGQKDIESDWDVYVEGLQGLGLADYIALTQQAINWGGATSDCLLKQRGAFTRSSFARSCQS